MSVLSDHELMTAWQSKVGYSNLEKARAVAEAAEAAMLAAAARAEPVAYQFYQMGKWHECSKQTFDELEKKGCTLIRKLYTSPPAAPVVPKKIDRMDIDYRYARGWNDCRDAMLAAAKEHCRD